MQGDSALNLLVYLQWLQHAVFFQLTRSHEMRGSRYLHNAAADGHGVVLAVLRGDDLWLPPGLCLLPSLALLLLFAHLLHLQLRLICLGLKHVLKYYKCVLGIYPYASLIHYLENFQALLGLLSYKSDGHLLPPIHGSWLIVRNHPLIRATILGIIV